MLVVMLWSHDMAAPVGGRAGGLGDAYRRAGNGCVGSGRPGATGSGVQPPVLLSGAIPSQPRAGQLCMSERYAVPLATATARETCFTWA